MCSSDLMAVFDVEPGELIDILSWAMENPAEPMLIDGAKASVFDNTITEQTKLEDDNVNSNGAKE